jgi:peptide-methionine (S)-S-oxide reductase
VSQKRETATFGGGCFWCLEAVFEQLEGVDRVVNGYAGGKAAHPTYEDVCSGETGHAEVVQVTFDPKVISYGELLDVFFTIHDPTTLNRQGADVGTQYRSAIFYHSADQKKAAEQAIERAATSGLWDDPIVTEVAPLPKFFAAEDYHQGYYRRNPMQGYCRAVISPKLAKFRAKWAPRIRATA